MKCKTHIVAPYAQKKRGKAKEVEGEEEKKINKKNDPNNQKCV